MNREEFEKQNPNLDWFTRGPIEPNKDCSPNLDNLIALLTPYMRKKEDMIICLEYSPKEERYLFGIYKEKK